MNVNALLGLCVVFHLAYFFSIFDIYFRSPIDTGITPVHDGLGTPPAKRAVLIVADGLRADTCFRFLGRDERYHVGVSKVGKELTTREANFQADATIWPRDKQSFLRDIVEREGAWGISHTRVPTESRPGHVAVIAGFYEDVSAVTRGWQDNPVEFDHVFNQSKRTWLWGSPDITRMFAKKHPHVHDWFYSPHEEDFAAKDLTYLDTWVFNRVSTMFKEAEKNETLRLELNQERVFFFLHLLGLDSNGHAYRPHAPEYYHNMATVDKGVQAMYELFQNFFKDNKTAFIFTADHGMGNQGAHGDGHPTNTRTPLVVWGAGIRGPENSSGTDPRFGINTGFSREREGQFSKNWGLDHLERNDVEQADIAPLLATLVGIPNPVNSVGRLPLGFLEHNRYSLRSLLRNALQLLAQVQHKENARKARQLFLSPFKPLVVAKEKLSQVQDALAQEESPLSETSYFELKGLCMEAMATCIEGLHYYQVYDRPYLMTIIVTGYIGWVLLLGVNLSPANADMQQSEWNIYSVFVATIMFALLGYQIFEQTPLMYHLYVLFSGVFWIYVLRKRRVLVYWKETVVSSPGVATTLVVYLIGTQLLVLGYTYRSVFVVLFIGLGCWPAWIPCIWNVETVLYPSHTGQIKKMSSLSLRLTWAAGSWCLGAFTLLPLDMHDNPVLLTAGSVIAIILLVVLFKGDIEGFTAHRILQLGLIATALVVTLTTDYNLRLKEGLPLFNQILTWSIFLLSPHLCLLSPTTPYKRYLSIFASLVAPFCLLSINYEVLFFTFLAFTLLQWLVIERSVFYHHSNRNEVANERKKCETGTSGHPNQAAVNMSDLRTAFIFMLMVHIAFFGTGNIASMSSFQLSATYRFVTVFSPFLMGTLCIVAKLIPYLLVTAHVSILADERFAVGVSEVSSHRLFFVVIAMYDMVAVHLFFWVRDSGSWLEIGNSISQFGLANAQCIFLPVLFALSSYFVQGITMDQRALNAKQS